MHVAGRPQKGLARCAGRIGQHVPLVVDLSDLASVRSAGAAAKALGPIDVLVNNAGVMGVSGPRTFDGFEMTMATNHFGPFLLTGLVLFSVARFVLSALSASLPHTATDLVPANALSTTSGAVATVAGGAVAIALQQVTGTTGDAGYAALTLSSRPS